MKIKRIVSLLGATARVILGRYLIIGVLLVMRLKGNAFVIPINGLNWM